LVSKSWIRPFRLVGCHRRLAGIMDFNSYRGVRSAAVLSSRVGNRCEGHLECQESCGGVAATQSMGGKGRRPLISQ
jgi:hypothetical protein